MQYPFDRTLSKVGRETPYSDKWHLQKSTANIIINGEKKLNVFLER